MTLTSTEKKKITTECIKVQLALTENCTNRSKTPGEIYKAKLHLLDNTINII